MAHETCQVMMAMMGWGGTMMGGMPPGSLWLAGLALTGTVLVVSQCRGSSAAERILEERLARGEIDPEQYQVHRHLLRPER
jgi:predicted aconitase with swiveling domain